MRETPALLSPAVLACLCFFARVCPYPYSLLSCAFSYPVSVCSLSVYFVCIVSQTSDKPQPGVSRRISSFTRTPQRSRRNTTAYFWCSAEHHGLRSDADANSAYILSAHNLFSNASSSIIRSGKTRAHSRPWRPHHGRLSHPTSIYHLSPSFSHYSFSSCPQKTSQQQTIRPTPLGPNPAPSASSRVQNGASFVASSTVPIFC